jgi:hypothetical protein
MLATLGHKQAKQLASCALATMADAIGLSRTISDRGSSDALLGSAKATVKSQLGLNKSSVGRIYGWGPAEEASSRIKGESKILSRAD